MVFQREGEGGGREGEGGGKEEGGEGGREILINKSVKNKQYLRLRDNHLNSLGLGLLFCTRGPHFNLKGQWFYGAIVMF